MVNDFLIKLNLKGFIRLIFFAWFFWYTIASLGASYYPIERGMFFYSIGAYIRLYGRKLNTAKGKIISVLFFCIAWVIGTCLYFREAEMSQITQTSTQIVNAILLRTTVTAFIIPITAITVFKLFESFDIGSNRAINAVASTSLGIYLIHDSILGRSFIWYDLLKVDTVLYSSAWFPIFAVVSILCVFLACFIIDTIRIRLFEPKALIKFDLLFDRLMLSSREDETKDQNGIPR